MSVDEKPPDPTDPATPLVISPELDDYIRKKFTDLVGDIDARISLEVEEQIKSFKETHEEVDKKRSEDIQSLRNSLDEKERTIAQLRSDLDLLTMKHPSYTRITEMKTRMENKSRETSKSSLPLITLPSISPSRV